MVGAVNLLYEGKKPCDMPSELDHVLTFPSFLPPFLLVMNSLKTVWLIVVRSMI